jgi:dTDP-4-amino-4,6-dideoxygalactose transaminase
MVAIQMVDLKRQYAHIKQEVDTAIQNVIDNTAFINGPDVAAFGNELAQYLGVKHVIPCANGTDALQIALMALGLKPGDEVITPSFTYIATVEVVALLNLQPIFVDVDMDTMTINMDSLRAAITPKTKAIIPVHLYGQSADMESLLAIAKEYQIPVVEDNAQAIGGSYTFSDGTTKMNGSMGTIGCTSFFPSKNLGCYGDGGALCTDNDDLARKIKMIANHGQQQKYVHEVIGCNSRLDSIQAAILEVKLRQLDNYVDARREVAERYDEAFASIQGVQIPFRADDSKHVFHQYTLVLEKANRNALQEHLAKNEIPSMIYYPIPAHKQEMFAAFGSHTTNLPTTDWLTERVISLPIHTEMDEEQQEFIIDMVKMFFCK